MTAVQCPRCRFAGSRVLETRASAEGTRRRRECMCGHRFTTVETVRQEPAK